MMGFTLAAARVLGFLALPTGSRLRAGGVLLEVTPEPHTGCLEYRQRFGKDALRQPPPA